MTVGELIEELQRLPQYHVVLVNVGLKYNESIAGVQRQVFDAKAGPTVVIHAESDPRNDPEPDEVWRLDGSEP